MGGSAICLAQRPEAHTITNKLKKGEIKVRTHIYTKGPRKKKSQKDSCLNSTSDLFKI